MGFSQSSESIPSDFLGSVMEALPTIVMVLTPDGRVTYTNRAFKQFTGYTEADLKEGYVWDLLLAHEDARIFRNAFRWLDADWFPNRSTVSWLLKNGTTRTLQAELTCITDTDEKLRYVVWQCTDLSKTQQQKENTQTRLLRYERIVETMHSALSVQNEEAVVLFVNDLFSDMLGYERNELIGRPLASIVTEDSQPVLEKHFARRRFGERTAYELQLAHRNGTPVNVLVTATPIFDDYQAFRGSFAIYTDISPYKEAERALRESNEELDAFAHTVAHDLKDPISVLTGFATLLEKDFTSMSDNELTEYLHIITRTGDKMINIIDELLLLARMRHIDKVQMQTLDMQTIVQEAITRMSYMIDQYGASITLPDAPWPESLGYPSWVEEVWVNYISNGIKYGGQPPKIELGADASLPGYVRFWVKDNGKGIPPGNRAQIFTPFTRLDNVRAKGHGLGLSIVQRIVQKLGGEVLMDSRMGKGSVFSFTLPKADVESLAPD